GNSLDLGETLATLDRELHRLVRYDALSVHLIEDCRITPAYAAGADFQILATLEARPGSGLLGSVAAKRQPVLNSVPEGSGRLALDPAGPVAEGIAAALRGVCREYDFVAHTGDSFVVLLADFARADLSRKRSQIAAVFRNAGLPATIGAALFPDDGSEAEDLLA